MIKSKFCHFSDKDAKTTHNVSTCKQNSFITWGKNTLDTLIPDSSAQSTKYIYIYLMDTNINKYDKQAFWNLTLINTFAAGRFQSKSSSFHVSSTCITCQAIVRAVQTLKTWRVESALNKKLSFGLYFFVGVIASGLHLSLFDLGQKALALNR